MGFFSCLSKTGISIIFGHFSAFTVSHYENQIRDRFENVFHDFMTYVSVLLKVCQGII